MKLVDLKVKSFVTGMDAQSEMTVVGGKKTANGRNCNSAIDACPSMLLTACC